MKNDIYELLDLERVDPVISKDNKLGRTIELNNLDGSKKIKTSKDDKKIKINKFIFPHGLRLCQIKTKYTNEFLFKKIEEIRLFYVKYHHEKILKTDEFTWETFSHLKGRVKKTKSLRETISLIEKTKPEYVKYIMLFFNQIMKCLKVDEKTYARLYKETYFGLFRYSNTYLEDKENEGIVQIKKDPHIRCHFDGFKEEPTISVFIGLGSDYYYDFVPYFFTKKDNLKPFRIKLHPLQAIIIDGESRVAWQHCLPAGYIKSRPKITLKFKIPLVGKYNKKYNKMLKKNFYTSTK